MAIDRNLLLRVLGSARGKSLSLEDVLVRATLDDGELPVLRRTLRELARQGLVEPEGKRWKLPAAPPATVTRLEPRREHKRTVEKPALARAPGEPALPPPLPRPPADPRREMVGTLTRKKEGYGFIASLFGGDDLFVPPQVMGDALDGDVVKARIGPGRDGRPVARHVEVVERRRQLAVGTYRQSGGPRGLAYVEPRDEQLGQRIEVPPTTLAKDGDVVRVRLEAYELGTMRGEVVSRLGLPGDPNVEVLQVAYAEGFADIFPADVLAASEATPDRVRLEDRAGRREVIDLDLVTIDGADARDFDDAIFVERTPRGYRLVVAIADVTAYVSPGGAIDREAIKRATSVYFPQHVLPMLPERLSNGICSLNPHVERLCMVADMALDRTGRPLDADLYPSVMRSRARCTYDQVAKLIDGGAVPELDHVRPMLLEAAGLAAKLTQVRAMRGAIDFDLPEPHIMLGKDGEVSGIERRPRNAAHRLVEEFMLAANEAVARYFEVRSLPTVYRVHAEPNEEKLQVFTGLAEVYGHQVAVDPKGRITAAELNEFLHTIEGRPEQRALNNLLLRAMMKAVYSSENIGHFGLAAGSYLHFTSPIRRYPDLVVHRLLKEHWARGGRVLPPDETAKAAERLEATAVHCSERERASMNAEREIDAFYAASLMRTKVGQRFPGVVASVAQFGLFIEIPNPFCEGLVRAETLGAGVRFDPERHRLVVPSRRGWGVGDTVEIEVNDANPLTRRVDFLLVEHGRLVDANGEARATRLGNREQDELLGRLERGEKVELPGARRPVVGKGRPVTPRGKPGGAKQGGGKGGKSGGGKPSRRR
jgi:ribonuclease R